MKMYWAPLKKIHPQLLLGIFLGLGLLFIIHSGSVQMLYTCKPEVPVPLDPTLGARHPGIHYKRVDDKYGIVTNLSGILDGSISYVKEEISEEAHIEIKNQDNDSVAQALSKTVRVLCWVMTSPTNVKLKAIHVKNTWGKRCNVLLFMSSEVDDDLSAVGLNVSEGRKHLPAKNMQAFSYVYEKHLDDADWFMKADDDTYVIVENLRYFLRDEDPEDLVYFGHKFRTFFFNMEFPCGGGGYVLSKAALKRFGERGRNDPKICKQDGDSEDVNMGLCLNNLGVDFKSSLDSLGQTRFHCFNPEMSLNKNFPRWYYRNDDLKGRANISDYVISFHYVTPDSMYHLEFYTYHMHPFGIISLD